MMYLFIIFLFSFQGELILNMTYGYQVQGRDDRKLDIAIKLNEFGTGTFLPGALLVNELPFRMYLSCLSSARHTKLIITIPVRHIPAWLPHISYKPLAQIGHNLGEEMMSEPMRFVKESIVGNRPGTSASS